MKMHSLPIKTFKSMVLDHLLDWLFKPFNKLNPSYPSFNRNVRCLFKEEPPESEKMQFFVKSLIEHQKGLRKESTKASGYLGICTLLYWLLFHGQLSELSFFSIKIKSSDNLLHPLPLLSAFFLYKAMLSAYHYFTIEKFLKIFYQEYLPNVAKHKMHCLLEATSESVLRDTNMTPSSFGIFFAGIISIIYGAILLTIIGFEMGTNIASLSFHEWKIAKIFVLLLSVIVYLRAVWITVEFFKIELKELWFDTKLTNANLSSDSIAMDRTIEAPTKNN